MPLDQGASKLQGVVARSFLSEKYGNAKIATHELQAVMRRGTPANKYQDLLTASRQQQQQQTPFAISIQTQFRSKLARQEFERQRLIGPSPFADPSRYPLSRGSDTPLGDLSIISDEDFDAWMAGMDAFR